MIRSKNFDLVFSKVLPFCLHNVPGLRGLILGGYQLHINEMGVVVKEDDEIGSPMQSSNRVGTTYIRVHQVKHVFGMRHRGRRVSLARMLHHDA